MDLKIDTVIVIDAWWNMPDVIARRILDVECDEIFCNNTFTHPICESLAHLEVKNDLRAFIKDCVEFKRGNGRSRNVLLVGQAWDCGIHVETLGVDNLVRFRGILNLFVNPGLMARDCAHLDRTCLGHHVEGYKYTWLRRADNFYECQG